MPPYQYLAGNDSLVYDHGAGAYVPITEPAVQAAIAADEVNAAAPPEVRYTGQVRLESRVQTTSALPAELFRRTLATMTAYSAMIEVVGVDNGNGACRATKISILVKRLSGDAILVGVPAVIANHADAAATAWTVNTLVGGPEFVITVAGAAGRTINWFARLLIDSFTPGGVP